MIRTMLIRNRQAFVSLYPGRINRWVEAPHKKLDAGSLTHLVQNARRPKPFRQNQTKWWRLMTHASHCEVTRSFKEAAGYFRPPSILLVAAGRRRVCVSNPPLATFLDEHQRYPYRLTRSWRFIMGKVVVDLDVTRYCHIAVDRNLR